MALPSPKREFPSLFTSAVKVKRRGSVFGTPSPEFIDETIRGMKERTSPSELKQAQKEAQQGLGLLPAPAIKNTYDMTEETPSSPVVKRAQERINKAAMKVGGRGVEQGFWSKREKELLLWELDKDMGKAAAVNKTETMRELLERTSMSDVDEQMLKKFAPRLYGSWRERFNRNAEQLRVQLNQTPMTSEVALSTKVLEQAEEAVRTGRVGAAQRYQAVAYNNLKHPNYQAEGALKIASRMEEGKPFLMTQAVSQEFADELADTTSAVPGGRNSEKYSRFLKNKAAESIQVDPDAPGARSRLDDPSNLGTTSGSVEKGLLREQMWKEDVRTGRKGQIEAERLLEKPRYKKVLPPYNATVKQVAEDYGPKLEKLKKQMPYLFKDGLPSQEILGRLLKAPPPVTKLIQGVSKESARRRQLGLPKLQAQETPVAARILKEFGMGGERKQDIQVLRKLLAKAPGKTDEAMHLAMRDVVERLAKGEVGMAGPGVMRAAAHLGPEAKKVPQILKLLLNIGKRV